jgi:hypothetical protein
MVLMARLGLADGADGIDGSGGTDGTSRCRITFLEFAGGADGIDGCDGTDGTRGRLTIVGTNAPGTRHQAPSASPLKRLPTKREIADVILYGSVRRPVWICRKDWRFLVYNKIPSPGISLPHSIAYEFLGRRGLTG